MSKTPVRKGGKAKMGNAASETNREQYIEVKSSLRELREAMDEYLKGVSNLPISERPAIDDVSYNIEVQDAKEENRVELATYNFSITIDEAEKLKGFDKWYHNRKLRTTGLTPNEMVQRNAQSKLEHPIEKAYGIVFDAIDKLNMRTEEGDRDGLMQLHEALKIDPDNEEAMYMICDVKLAMDEFYGEVREFVDRLLTIRGKEPQAHAWKAQILAYGGFSGSRAALKLREAQRHAIEACDMDPESFDFAALAAQISHWIKDDDQFAKAVADMNRIDRRRAKRFMAESFIYEIPN